MAIGDPFSDLNFRKQIGQEIKEIDIKFCEEVDDSKLMIKRQLPFLLM
ncbi:7976_t:CDS:2, partial [Dentiscutata heterogama]